MSGGQPGPPGRIIIHVDPELQGIVPGFLDRRRQDVCSIRTALEQGDYDSVRRTGHMMKGAGSSYGFDGITQVGQSLEEAAGDENAPRICGLLDELVSYLQRVELVYAEPGDSA